MIIDRWRPAVGGKTRSLRLAAAFAAVYLGWGSTYLAIRFGIETLPPLLMQGGRFLLAGALLYAWQRVRGARRPRPNEWRAAIVVGLLLPACGSGGVAWAEQFVSSGLAATLIATEPLCVVLLVWSLSRNRPSPATLWGLALGFVGVAMLSLPGVGVDQPAMAAGAIAVLMFASVAWAVGSLYSRRAPLHPSAPLAAAMSLLAAGVILLAAGGLGGEVGRLDLSRVTPASGMAFAYLVVVGSLIAYNAYLWLTRVASPVRVSTYAYVNPIVALGLGWLAAGEALSVLGAVAALAIITGVVLVVAQRPEGDGCASDATRREQLGEDGSGTSVPIGVVPSVVEGGKRYAVSRE